MYSENGVILSMEGRVFGYRNQARGMMRRLSEPGRKMPWLLCGIKTAPGRFRWIRNGFHRNIKMRARGSTNIRRTMPEQIAFL